MHAIKRRVKEIWLKSHNFQNLIKQQLVDRFLFCILRWILKHMQIKHRIMYNPTTKLNQSYDLKRNIDLYFSNIIYNSKPAYTFACEQENELGSI